jgi:hypothetical protein
MITLRLALGRDCEITEHSRDFMFNTHGAHTEREQAAR